MSGADGSIAMSAAPGGGAGGIMLKVKVVPGASRSRIAGLLGDRLKVSVAAPPEGGKANRAVCELVAHALGVPARDVEVVEGHTQPRKTLAFQGVSLCQSIERLGRHLAAD